MEAEDAGPSDAGSVSGYSELGSTISSQLPTDTLGYAAMMLAEAELRLEGATRQEQETDAMLLLARREHGELKELNSTLRDARDVLRKKIVAKRRGKAQELAVGAHFSEAYDWVCEITKLTAVSQEGWKLQYSDNFLRNMTDAERVMLIGTTQAMPNCEEDGCSDDGSLADSSPDPTPTPTPTPTPGPSPSPSPSPSRSPNPSPNPNQARSPTRAMGT